MSSSSHCLGWPAILMLLGCLTASAQEPLTLRQAIDRAIHSNPEVAAARAGNQSARAAAVLARSQLLPKLNFTEDASRGNDPVYAFGMRLRQQQFTSADFALNALNRPQPIANFATRFSGSWVGFDSFKTEKDIHGADLLRQSAASSAAMVDQQVVLQVVRAYQSALYAQREIDVAQHQQQTAEALLSSAKDRVEAGLAIESDRISAQVNAAARQEELIAAQGDFELAWETLCEAMGDPDLKPSELRPIEFHSFPQLSLQEELAEAVKMRPDLMAMGEAQSAQSAAVGAARSDFGPRVSAYGNWEEDRGSLTASGGNNWVAGFEISIDILPAGKRAQLAQQNAALQKVNAQQALLRQQSRLEVVQAHIRQKTSALSLETARASVDQASESLRILKNRYSAGLATITDLLRAEDAERQSQSTYWRAVYTNALAYAGLLYSTGTLTPDAAEVLQ